MTNPENKNNLPNPDNNPGGGFSIEIKDIDRIYEHIRSNQFITGKYTEYLDGRLGEMVVIDNLVRDIKFDVIKNSQTSVRDTPEYNLSFQIKKEVKFEKGEDAGTFDESIRYFSKERVIAMVDYMKRFVGSAEYNTNMKGEQIIKVKRDGQLYLINLGYPNFELNELYVKMMGGNVRTGNFYSKKIAEYTLASRYINVNLGDIKDYSQLFKDYFLHLSTKEDFEKTLKGFCSICVLTTNCFYNSFQEKPLREKFLITWPKEEKILSLEDNKRCLVIEETESLSEISETINVVLDKEKLVEDGFGSIAGQTRAVIEAKKFSFAIANSKAYEDRGIKIPKGILLYGPTGNGKTLIAKAIASEVNAEVFEVSGSDIHDKWYGESERKMQEVFDKANEVTKTGRKAVIIFDEMDALAQDRGESYEASRKVVAVMLQNLDGFRSNKDVLIVGMTNRPEDIDPAIKRPGRIDRIIEVGLPDLDGRKEILQLHINQTLKRSKFNDNFSPDLDIQKMAEITDGWSGAELAEIITTAVGNKIVLESEGIRWAPVNNNDLEKAMTIVKEKKEEKRRIGF